MEHCGRSITVPSDNISVICLANCWNQNNALPLVVWPSAPTIPHLSPALEVLASSCICCHKTVLLRLPFVSCWPTHCILVGRYLWIVFKVSFCRFCPWQSSIAAFGRYEAQFFDQALHTCNSSPCQRPPVVQSQVLADANVKVVPGLHSKPLLLGKIDLARSC